MAFWDRYGDADRLERAATGFEPGDTRPAVVVPPFVLAIAAVIVILGLVLFAAGPRLRFTDDRSAYAGDEIAAQRLADIGAERRLAETRGSGWRQSEVIDAHVSSFQARSSVR